MQEHKKEELIHKIGKAFHKTPYPGRKIAIHNYTQEVDTFVGKQWQDITADDIQYWSFHFLTLEAFHYYLPAFLVAIIKTPDKVDFMAVENLIKRLQFGDWVKKKICQLFTKQQKAVIWEFLSSCESLYPEAYWENVHDEVQKASEYWADC